MNGAKIEDHSLYRFFYHCISINKIGLLMNYQRKFFNSEKLLMDILQITDIPNWSWKRRAGSFIAVFSGIWLFTDPFLTFLNATSLIKALGGWGFLVLLLISIIATMFSEFVTQKSYMASIRFIKFNVTLVESGKRILVKAPKDMLVIRFLDLFLSHIAKDSTPDSNLFRHDLYTPTLMVFRTGDFEDIFSIQTLADAGIKDMDECRIRAEIKEPNILYDL
jgi:hypothetical protein